MSREYSKWNQNHKEQSTDVRVSGADYPVVVSKCLDMSMLLYKANSSYEKTEPLREFLGKFGMLQMLLRVCAEQKVIDTKKVAVFALEMEKIGKQATGWKQYNEKGKQ